MLRRLKNRAAGVFCAPSACASSAGVVSAASGTRSWPVSRTTEKENAAEAVLLKGNKIIFLKTGTIFIVPVLLFWLIHRNIAYQVVLKFLALYTSSDIRPPVFECR